MRKLFLLGLVALLTSAFVWAQPSMDDPIPFDKNTVVGKLENGFTYYIKKNTKPENFAEVRLAVNAGSVLETDKQLGLAHFVEHMCFNGTKNFPGNGVVDFLQSIGSRFGAHVNAYTSFDETVYMLRIPTEDDEIFSKGIQVMEDWAHQVNFSDEEIDKERGVIVEEWRTGQGPNQRMNNQIFPTIFYKSKYAERLPIGKLDVLKSFEYQTLKDFYNKWYRPDYMALVVVGDVDVEKTEALIKEKFSKIAKPAAPLERPNFQMPDHQETIFQAVRDAEAPVNVMRLLFKQESKNTLTLGDYRESMVRSLTTSMLQSRLSEKTEDPSAPFSFAGISYSGVFGIRAKDAYSLFAVFPEGKALMSLETMLIENKKASKYGFTQSELDRTKTAFLSSLEKQFNEKDKTNSRSIVMKYVYHFLNESPAPGIENQLALYKNYLPGITLEEVNAMMKSFITENNQVVILTGPEKESNVFPTEDEVMATFDKVKDIEVTAYEDNVASGPLLENIPTAGSIKSENKIESIGVTELTLSNGVKVVLKPTNFQNDQVMMRAYSKGGNSLYPDSDYMSAAFSDALVGSSGLGNFDNIQLEKYLSDKQLQLNPFIGELSEGMNGNFSPKDIETFFQMVHLYFTQPKIDEKVFQSTMNRFKGIFPTLLNLPEQWFSNATSEYLYNGSIRRKGIFSVEEMDMVKPNRVLEIFKDRFADADDFTFMFVGNFEVEEFKEYLTTYIATLPVKEGAENWKDPGVKVREGKLSKNFYKGQEDKSLVRLMYRGDMDWEGSERSHIKALGEALAIMLVKSLREEKGGVYSPSARANYQSEPTARYNIEASFYCAPANVDELVETVFQDVNTLKKKGPSEEVLQKIKEARRKSYQIGLKENSYWMSGLVFAYQNDLDPTRILEYEKGIDALTVKSIKKAAKKYFNDKELIRMVLLPEDQK
ncbi:MAG: insulinase family protein [Bacteroidia bacterium]|nr:insulinase family protein [Bacteroidia bacterium]